MVTKESIGVRKTGEVIRETSKQIQKYKQSDRIICKK